MNRYYRDLSICLRMPICNDEPSAAGWSSAYIYTLLSTRSISSLDRSNQAGLLKKFIFSHSVYPLLDDNIYLTVCFPAIKGGIDRREEGERACGSTFTHSLTVAAPHANKPTNETKLC